MIDLLLDEVEDTVQESGNVYINTVVLPLCKLIRDSLNIPDNDEQCEIKINIESFCEGIYLYRIFNKSGIIKSDKLLIK